jgi:ferric-dicitrate binding protein FerR (iron transport regulator)
MTEYESYKQLVTNYQNNKATDKELEVFFHLLEEGKLDSIINEAVSEDFEKASTIRRVIPLVKLRWFKVAIAAAAVILLFVSISIVLFRNNKPVNEINQVVEIPEAILLQKPLYKNDIKPGGNKAILTLADGSKIVLDDASEGALSRQGNTTVIKLDKGKLAYNTQTVSQIPVKTTLYNTLTTPRGGQYCVILPDGSTVWLNASTSLKYPTAFAGNERKVEIEGEAYFEIAKNEAMPFIVTAGNSEIKVLGTHFNVSAYSDDKVLKTTLLEGSVEFSLAKQAGNSNEGSAIKLQPGQQVQLDEANTLAVVEVDTEEAIAWKNGLFIFNNEDLGSIMQKITRWYDVKVVYDVSDTDKYFNANISRALNVSEVLRALELTEAIHFKIEGKTITVLP